MLSSSYPCVCHFEKSLPSKSTMASEGGAPGVAPGVTIARLGPVDIVYLPFLSRQHGGIGVAGRRCPHLLLLSKASVAQTLSAIDKNREFHPLLSICPVNPAK